MKVAPDVFVINAHFYDLKFYDLKYFYNILK